MKTIAKKKKAILPKIGRKYVKSQFEFDVYKGLKNLLPRGADLDYESEKLTYTITSEYIPDFIITYRDGRKLYIEAKGNGRAFDNKVRQKLIAVKEQHPDIDLKIVFYSNGKIGPKRKDGSFRKQEDWAKQHGFDFAIGIIPKEWLGG
mgnify:FL=1